MTDRVKRFIAIPLVAITILGCTVSPATVSIAHADPKPWQYVPDDDDCKEPQSTPSDSTSENQEGVGGGDWMKEGTETNKVMKQMFKIMTEEYGISGAAAAGILGAISMESHFVPDIAEMTTTPIRFGMNSKTPPASMNTADAGGGGGLFQFTPYTKFCNGDFWSKPNSESGGGWYPENQIAAAWNEAILSGSWSSFAAKVPRMYDKTTKYTTEEAFLSNTDDPAGACEAWAYVYERGAKWAFAQTIEQRKANAIKINEYLNKNNIQADKSKWEAHGYGKKMSANLASVGGSIIAENNNKKKCKEVQNGEIEKGSYLDAAKQIAADKFVGYQYGAGHSDSFKTWTLPTEAGDQFATGLDCSAFVTQCFRLCSNSTLNKIDQCLSAGTGSFDGYLTKKFKFTKHNYTSKDDLQAGDILLRDQEHTEIVLGWYDTNKLDSDGNPTETEKGKGTLLVIGAHNDQDGKSGDGGQKGDKEWYTPYVPTTPNTTGGEVSAMPFYEGDGWDYYYRPDPELLKSDEKTDEKSDENKKTDSSETTHENEKAQTNKKAKHEPKMV